MIAQQLVDETTALLDLELDDALVRAEFDALIAECWEDPCEPPPDKPCARLGGWPARPSIRSTAHEAGIATDLAPSPRPHVRGRGPP
jgi:hypothetical protein